MTTKNAPNLVVQAMFDATQAMAEAVAGIEARPTSFRTKELEIAKHIKASDFGCQRENVAKLMELVTGLPIEGAYKSLNVAKDGGNIPQAMRKAGAVLVVIESGEAGLVWCHGAVSLRIAGRCDLQGCYDTSKVRPATMDEIIDYVRRDAVYIRRNLGSIIPESLNPLEGI